MFNNICFCTVLVHVNHFRRGGKFAFLTVGGVGGGKMIFNVKYRTLFTLQKHTYILF